jgi:hypothetical protein
LIKSDLSEESEWMKVLSKADMTEDQIQEFNTFKRKEKEKELVIKERTQKLSKELKTLESEIRNLTSSFNQHFGELQQEHYLVKNKLRSNEFHLLMLAESVLQTKDIEYMEEHVYKKKQVELEQLHKCASNDLDRVKVEYERVKNDLTQQIHLDKLADKGFRKKIQEVSSGSVDQETVNLLHQIFQQRGPQKEHMHNYSEKKRSIKKRGTGRISETPSITRRSKIGRQSGRDSGGSQIIGSFTNSRSSSQDHEEKNDNSIMNNMKLAMKEANADEQDEQESFIAENEPFPIQDVAVKHLDPGIGNDEPSINDVPEGFIISDKVWSMMLKLRNEKIRKETEVQKAIANVKSMKTLFEGAENEEIKASIAIADLDAKIKESLKRKNMEIICPQILVKLQQGQDEVKDSSSAINYRDAIFISSDPIQNMNKTIREFGSKKMSILSKTKDLRKRINQIKWNNELLELHENHEKELYVDFQLMHLSNELKMMLNGDTEDLRVKESNIDNQLQRQKGAFNSKIKKLQSQEKNLKKTIRERTRENLQLEQQLDSLRNAVKAKEANFEVS